MWTRRGVIAGLAGAVTAAAIGRGEAAGLPILGRAHDGHALGAEELGGWRLVYFGYTHCPDVCPLGLSTMAEALDALGRLAEQVTPVFVTVDPARDTPAVMKDYVAFFHPRLIGVTPDAEQLTLMARAWRIKFARVEVGEGRPYLMDHSASLLLADPAGTAAGRFPHDMGGARMAEKIRVAMATRP